MKEEDLIKNETEKIYIFGELEKLASDKDYYLSNKEKTKEFIDLNYKILGRLGKIHSLNKKEIKITSKTKNWMIKLSKMIK